MKSTYYAMDSVLRRGLHDSMHTLVTVLTVLIPPTLCCCDFFRTCSPQLHASCTYSSRMFGHPADWLIPGLQVGLIVALLVGTVASGTFVGLQIAYEGRTAVLIVTEALPSWSLKPSDQATALSTQVATQTGTSFSSLSLC